MSRTLYKASHITVEEDQVRTIDADQLFVEKVGQLPEPTGDEDDPIAKYGFDPYGDGDSPAQAEEDPSVLALFGEEAPKSGSDPLFDEPIPAEDSFGADGFVSGLEAEEVDEATMGTGVNNEHLQQASMEAEELLEQARAEAERIIDNARSEAQDAVLEMYKEAEEKGRAEGFARGEQEAAEQLKAAEADFKQHAREMQEEYDEKMRMMEPRLVEELTGIYEHIFTVDLSGYRDVIRHLITNTMHSVESSQTYLIHVSPQDYAALSMQKSILRDECGIPDGSTMEFVEDISLGKNQCLIETDDGIFDCSLTVQLAELKKKLMLLAYEGTR